MRYLGIDFGTRNIGLATSDEEGRLAFPHSVIENSPHVAQHIAMLVAAENIDAVIVGESIDQTGEANPLMNDITEFTTQMSVLVEIPIHFEQEMFTSLEASKQDLERPTARKPKSKIIKKDDSAAALILQRYLDKQQDE
jgi:putative Holliday junction resolvase